MAVYRRHSVSRSSAVNVRLLVEARLRDSRQYYDQANLPVVLRVRQQTETPVARSIRLLLWDLVWNEIWFEEYRELLEEGNGERVNVWNP
jgi:hypothetical protein